MARAAVSADDVSNFAPNSWFIRLIAKRQCLVSNSMPRATRPCAIDAIIVVPLPTNGSSAVSPGNDGGFTRRRGNSSGNGASCPMRLPLSPGNDQTPHAQSLNSSALMSLAPCRYRFHSSLHRMMIVSTGAIMRGALADFQLPQAARRLMLPWFHITVAWYFQPALMAATVVRRSTAACRCGSCPTTH